MLVLRSLVGIKTDGYFKGVNCSGCTDQNIVHLFNLQGNCKIDSIDASEALVSTKLIIKASNKNCIHIVSSLIIMP